MVLKSEDQVSPDYELRQETRQSALNRVYSEGNVGGWKVKEHIENEKTDTTLLVKLTLDPSLRRSVTSEQL